VIKDAKFSNLPYLEDIDSASQDEHLSQALNGLNVHEISDWTDTINKASTSTRVDPALGGWLNTVFGRSFDKADADRRSSNMNID
jgi:hypothetical protein